MVIDGAAPRCIEHAAIIRKLPYSEAMLAIPDLRRRIPIMVNCEASFRALSRGCVSRLRWCAGRLQPQSAATIALVQQYSHHKREPHIPQGERGGCERNETLTFVLTEFAGSQCELRAG
jgi:hypothetical protein